MYSEVCYVFVMSDELIMLTDSPHLFRSVPVLARKHQEQA